MLTAAQVGELDSRLLRVLERSTTYQPARGLELQALVNDAREHLAGGAVSYDSALAIVAAVESRALVLGLLDAAAGVPATSSASSATSSGSGKRPSSSGASTDRTPYYAAAAGGALTVPAASPTRVALAGAGAGVKNFWDGLSPLGRLAIAGVVVGVGVLAWRRWGPA